jgi:hypothetical protein
MSNFIKRKLLINVIVFLIASAVWIVSFGILVNMILCALQ